MSENRILHEKIGLLVEALFESRLNAEQAEELEELVAAWILCPDLSHSMLPVISLQKVPSFAWVVLCASLLRQTSLNILLFPLLWSSIESNPDVILNGRHPNNKQQIC
jgi:hypothetical protein